MKILVSTAGRHGATDSLGRELARVFEHSGGDVDLRAPASVACVDDYDALVIGSAVYSDRWVPAAKALVDRVSRSEHPPVWLFSCGPLHSSDRPVNVTSDAAHAASVLHATAHRTFPGKLDPERLSAGERQIFENSGAVAGDFRDWVLVCNWAREILACLTAGTPGS
ncbi:flavodoxin [Rhodococcus sp. ARC_M12]|uniref:flavodoxin domain-containing protein n=1 Tax=unclassified Rhodococcus (in: high G+C Gram-positive bacteria) TaxID=192944 RepID=UPI001FB260A5|nr:MULTISPECIES: flavodoxin domain-containing protein [unclassified Rhodococcus (in: high G+C Gram-positive bacteria)]MCJ0891988.1 flavodoxin [Rhodococcus sp. ARC_M5]MCJ0980145.1 flavodoxin [Rhodococcus sp. ARC_M12]